MSSDFGFMPRSQGMDKPFASTGSLFGITNNSSSSRQSALAKTSRAKEVADATSETNNKISDINEASSATPTSSLVSAPPQQSPEAEGSRARKRPRTEDESPEAADPQKTFHRGDCCIYEYKVGKGLFQIFKHSEAASGVDTLGDYYALVPLGEELTSNNLCFVGFGKRIKKTRFNLGDKIPLKIGSKELTNTAVVKTMRIVEDKLEYEVDINGSSVAVLEEELE